MRDFAMALHLGRASADPEAGQTTRSRIGCRQSAQSPGQSVGIEHGRRPLCESIAVVLSLQGRIQRFRDTSPSGGCRPRSLASVGRPGLHPTRQADAVESHRSYAVAGDAEGIRQPCPGSHRVVRCGLSSRIESTASLHGQNLCHEFRPLPPGRHHPSPDCLPGSIYLHGGRPAATTGRHRPHPRCPHAPAPSTAARHGGAVAGSPGAGPTAPRGPDRG